MAKTKPSPKPSPKPSKAKPKRKTIRPSKPRPKRASANAVLRAPLLRPPSILKPTSRGPRQAAEQPAIATDRRRAGKRVAAKSVPPPRLYKNRARYRQLLHDVKTKAASSDTATLRELSLALGKSVPFLSQFFGGQRGASLRLVMDMARHLQVPVEILVPALEKVRGGKLWGPGKGKGGQGGQGGKLRSKAKQPAPTPTPTPTPTPRRHTKLKARAAQAS